MRRNSYGWACLALLYALCCAPGASAAFAPRPPVDIKSQQKKVQQLQQRLWQMQVRFHKLLAEQHKQQLAMGELRLKQHQLYIQQQRLQQKHLQLQMKLRRSQLRQIRLQMKLSRRRAALHRARAAQLARRHAANKRPAKKSKAKTLSRWYGYMVSPKTPVGPKMVMQHPLVAPRQSYANIVSKKGKYLQQAIVVFGLVTPPPRDGTKLILFTGTTRTIGPLRGRPGTKGAGYRGLVIRVRSWKIVKTP